MVLNESVGHQYAILLRNYGIAFNQAVILIVNNFGKSLLETVSSLNGNLKQDIIIMEVYVQSKFWWLNFTNRFERI